MNEKRFAYDVIDNWSVPKYISSLFNSKQTKETKNPTWLKDEQETRRDVFQKDMQLVNRHLKRCSTLLIIKELLMKTTMRPLNTCQNGYPQKVYK